MAAKLNDTSDNIRESLAVIAGHFMNDFYMNLIPPILFIFAGNLQLTMAQQGMLSATIVIGGSFAQPGIGLLVDKKGQPWLLIMAVLWVAVWMSVSGWIENYYLLLVVLGIGSLASALYHPLGSAIMVQLGKKSKGKSLSLFMTIGALAASVSPITALPVVSRFGLKSLIYFVIPGIITAVFMYWARIKKIRLQQVNGQDMISKGDWLKQNIKGTSIMVLISTNQEFIRRLFITFGGQFLLLKGISMMLTGVILSAYLFGNAAGTLIGGYLSDKNDDKKVIIGGSLLITICVGAFLLSSIRLVAVLAFIMIGVATGSLYISSIILTQGLIPHRVNMATGLIMGLASSLGGLGLLPFGWFADNSSLLSAAWLLFIPLILTNILTTIIPKERSDSHLSESSK